MKIAIIGATGTIGQRITARAIDRSVPVLIPSAWVGARFTAPALHR